MAADLPARQWRSDFGGNLEAFAAICRRVVGK
jgi:hypothetical protein